MHLRHIGAIAVTLAATSGWAGEARPAAGSIGWESPMPDVQGRSINARSLNGTSLVGASTDGRSLVGRGVEAVALGGAMLNGEHVGGVTLEATVFTGTTAAGPISGGGFAGSVWGAQLTDGTTVALRVDGASPLPAPNEDVHGYAVSYQTSAGWAPLCGTAAALAIPVPGAWSYGHGVAGGGGWTPDGSRFTFACQASAIAKCVELGYKPWRVVGGKKLDQHLVACTRVLRGDYCGNGTSWSVDGSSVNVYDREGVQTDRQQWAFEAAWTAAGARVVSGRALDRLSTSFGSAPGCGSDRAPPPAGDPASLPHDALLVTEFRP